MDTILRIIAIICIIILGQLFQNDIDKIAKRAPIRAEYYTTVLFVVVITAVGYAVSI